MYIKAITRVFTLVNQYSSSRAAKKNIGHQRAWSSPVFPDSSWEPHADLMGYIMIYLWIICVKRTHKKKNLESICIYIYTVCIIIYIYMDSMGIIEGSLEAKLPTIWTDEKQSREESERRDSSEEKRSEERRCRCAKR